MNHHTPPPPPPPPIATTTITPKTTPTTGQCGNCSTHVRFFLHHVRLRGIHRRLCTKCVLLLHPQSFCPVCFAFYDSNPPHPSKRLSCSKCSSFTHSHCATSLSSSISQQQHPYICPPCSDPTKSFALFSNSKSESSSSSSTVASAGGRVIDGKSAGVMLCACKIASASMGKAVLVARIEAEKKAKDAALARKRAREAMEKVALLINKSNNNNINNNINNNNKEPEGSVVQISGSAASFFNVVNNKQQQSVSQDNKKSISQELINKVNLQTDK